MNGKRYIFYDNLNGEIIVEESRNRIEIMPTIERVIEIYPKLSERNRETFDILELSDSAYSQDFAEARLIGVDLATRIPLFEYPNPENPAEPITPPKPLSIEVVELKQENILIKTDLGNILLESAMDKAKIAELETAQGDLLMEIAMLKMGGNA